MTFNDISDASPFKANIFIDWLNVKANGGQGLEFSKLTKLIRSKDGNIIRVNIYLPEADSKQASFYDVIKRAGFKLIIIPPKWDSVNCDALMAIEMVITIGRIEQNTPCQMKRLNVFHHATTRTQ